MGGGKVYLTGGGCGDADLITWKAVQVLQRCDTVVYDSLVSEELLRWTGPDCEKIYVGKRYGCHSRKQSEINALLTEKAREGRTVVRLKGGDPYVFGRGGEEFLALQAAGVSCEEIPGITSAVAVPAAAGIPVTHRGLSDSVTVVTGTAGQQEGQAEPGPALELDFPVLAKLRGTLVILMGMHYLAEIVAGLIAAGKDQNTPCAIIMEGTTERQRVLRSPLAELSERAAKQGFTSPAVIVVGAVAELKLTTEAFVNPEGTAESRRRSGTDRIAEVSSNRKETAVDSREGAEVNQAAADDVLADGTEKEEKSTLPLRAIRVGVTGTAHFADRVSSALRGKGAEVWDMSFMKINPVEEPLPDFAAGGWLVFTSPNGVHVFLEKMRRERRDLRTLSNEKIAVIGPGTAAAWQEAGLYADYMPEIYDSRHLAQGLSDIIESERRDADRKCGKAGGNEARMPRPVMLLRAAQGSAALTEIFRKRGIPCVDHPLYELGVQEEKRDAVIAKTPDYIVFGSAMGARAYFKELEKNGIQSTGSRYVCIGEHCAKEVQKYAAEPPLITEEASVEAIVKLLTTLYNSTTEIGFRSCPGIILKKEGNDHVPIQKTEKR